MSAPLELLIGDPAPDFLPAGQRLALCFYPADDLPGAIAQLTGLRDAWPEIGGRARILGISAALPEVQKRLVDGYALPFELLSDPGDAIARAHGLWLGAGGGGDAEGGSPTERATFIINAAGRIEAILRDFTPAAHADCLSQALRRSHPIHP